MKQNESVSFDRIADRYDETRGGTDRGARYAPAFMQFLNKDDLVLEVGVGTAGVGRPLTDAGCRVVGLDLSSAMLQRASQRLPNRVLNADATMLPVSTASCDAVISVWVLHLVGDMDAMIAEAARALKVGGLFLIVAADADEDSNEIRDIIRPHREALGRYRDRPAAIADRMAGAGFEFMESLDVARHEFKQSPAHLVNHIEDRTYSYVWDLTQDEWDAKVQPTLDALRALPDQERDRDRVHTHLLSAYRRV